MDQSLHAKEVFAPRSLQRQQEHKLTARTIWVARCLSLLVTPSLLFVTLAAAETRTVTAEE